MSELYQDRKVGKTMRYSKHITTHNHSGLKIKPDIGMKIECEGNVITLMSFQVEALSGFLEKWKE